MKLNKNKSSINRKIISNLLMPLLSFSGVAHAEVDDLTELSLEDLMNVEVTSVNRHAESLLDSAAAIHVISSQDIHRSGATSIPEVLRMVPGLYVAQIDSSKWMVGARSFSGRYSNNLQVMVDGRSIYTPAYNGVYWEQLDIVMDDIERIEVIRGPGSTLWGANAVNGVINIITKSASSTLGGYAKASVGNQQNSGTLRYGAQLNPTTYGRSYIKYRKNNPQKLANGEDSYDEQDNQQAGFRLDSTLSNGDKLTFQGDIYNVSSEQVENIPTLISPFSTNINNTRKSDGWNVLGRWKKPLTISSDTTLQVYIDHYSVDELALSPHENTTYDIDFQHHITFNDTHDFIWGLGFYRTHTDIKATETAEPIKFSVDRNRFSGFVQDEISLIQDKLTLTLGSKFEHNDVTGFEYQPTARLLFKPSDNQSIWTSVSRSVRSPSIGEQLVRLNLATIPTQVQLGAGAVVLPNKLLTSPRLSHFDSETAYSYELGYRIQPSSTLSFDSAIYYTEYRNMRGASPLQTTFTGTHLETLFAINNQNKAAARGFELSAKWQAKDNLRLVLDYSLTHHSISTVDGLEPDSTPEQSLSLRSMFDINSDVTFDTWLRYAAETNVGGFINSTVTETVSVPSYWNIDMRLAWQANKQLELALVGKNLLHNQQLEGANPTYSRQIVEIKRSVFAVAKFKF